MFSKEKLQRLIKTNLHSMQGKPVEEAGPLDWYFALVGALRETVSENWIKTNRRYRESGVKQAYYFSMEFLLGKLTPSYMMNLGCRDVCAQALEELGAGLEEVEEAEPDTGLGNGGLGRLAACFLDSLASLGMPGHGCGIRYKFGHFNQKIIDGYQVEVPDNWLREKNAWEIRKSDKAFPVRFGGHVRAEHRDGRLVFVHEGYETVLAVPYDIPVIGYRNSTVNTLRLWHAEMPEEEETGASGYRRGNFLKKIENRSTAEEISYILYPDDSSNEGRILRLKQEYFLVSAGIRSILRTFKKRNRDLSRLGEKVAIHINDTHPSLAIPELMRILVDEEGFGWDEAWKVTRETISYTNHTIMGESMEQWPVDIFHKLLPRIFMIVEEINERFCRELWQHHPGDWNLIHRMAVIADGQVKMVHLAVVGSRSVNGVSRLHTDILKNRVLKRFYTEERGKFNNKTNGVSHRRFLIQANPGLADLISDSIGREWIEEPEKLHKILDFSNDAGFLEQLALVKRQNKERLASYIREHSGLAVDVDSIFDIHVKRIHAYKRQLLNILHIIYLYRRILEDPSLKILPRTFIFAGKAAPGYDLAKLIIKLINTAADKINKDPRVNRLIKVVFLDNYRVSLAELIIPAADVSEQISTAGKEASGTGNMKFMMNGAVTLGTMDGANVEIGSLVGAKNIVTFGLNAEETAFLSLPGNYSPLEFCRNHPYLKELVKILNNGCLSAPPGEFKPLVDALLHHDEFFVLKDFDSYAQAQEEISRCYGKQEVWRRMCNINIGCSGIFSSDRAVREYAAEIWGIKPFWAT